jgi:hypothetical protein
VQTRPAPLLADRFILGFPIDYGPVLLLMPFGFHLAMDTLPSGRLLSGGFRFALAVSSFRFRARLDVSIPFRFLRPARFYPRLWIRRPSFGRPRDFNPHEQRAAQRALCRCPTPRRRARGPYGLSLLPPSWHYVSTGISEVSRFSCMKYLGVSGVFDYAGLKQELALAPLIMLPAAITRASASGLHLFGAQYPPHLFPCLRFAVHLTMPSAKLGAEWIASPFS